MTEDKFVELFKANKDDPGLKKYVTEMVYSFLGPMDVNHNGYLDPEEYSRPFEGAGLDAANFTKAAFDAIDTNHDGKLSFAEFDKAIFDYFCSDAESSTAAFGLLF